MSQRIVREGREEGQDSFQGETMEMREEEERLETFQRHWTKVMQVYTN